MGVKFGMDEGTFRFVSRFWRYIDFLRMYECMYDMYTPCLFCVEISVTRFLGLHVKCGDVLLLATVSQGLSHFELVLTCCHIIHNMEI